MALFAAGLVCHGRLSDSRPGASRLTEFYLLVALGGVLGGAFNALVAPLVFRDLYEYPIALAAACFLRARWGDEAAPRREVALDLVVPALLAAYLVFAPRWAARFQEAPHVRVWIEAGLPGVLCLATLGWRRRFGLSFAVLLVPTVLMGLTLPVLSACALVRGARFGSRLSALYAVNTAGAVSGAVIAGFYLIGAIGMQRSFLVAAAVNVTVGAAVLIVARRAEAIAHDDGVSAAHIQDLSATADSATPVRTIGAMLSAGWVCLSSSRTTQS